ncbi:hypothetical protein NPIL_222221 [Nephila pilipes]|uniref:Uncharacterized protein n=1 Tax=Nephila pilipes TaxID=299642 RepID=A0A8X6MNI9_NEPPI|nr:hypothetical protein NPIL_222221 [Nephila pilipes]
MSCNYLTSTGHTGVIKGRPRMNSMASRVYVLFASLFIGAAAFERIALSRDSIAVLSTKLPKIFTGINKIHQHSKYLQELTMQWKISCVSQGKIATTPNERKEISEKYYHCFLHTLPEVTGKVLEHCHGEKTEHAARHKNKVSGIAAKRALHFNRKDHYARFIANGCATTI